jgi:hypothetical protein
MAGTVYFFCHQNRYPTGGDQVIYRHARMLGELGIPTCVIHPKSGFCYPQLDKPPEISSLKEVRFTAADLLVLPEDLGPYLNKAAPGTRKILFNQSIAYSFRGYTLGPESLLPPYLHKEYVQCITVSEYSRDWLEFTFPGLKCERIHLSINHELFHNRRPDLKQRRICYFTRKNTQDQHLVLQSLRSRNYLKNWGLDAIENITSDGVADVMSRAAICLSFGLHEGLGLANLEAMASGCRLIGYSGYGGQEFFSSGRAVEVPPCDIPAFVQAIEAEAQRYEDQPDQFFIHTTTAARWVRQNYSRHRELEDLRRIYFRAFKGDALTK